MAEVYHAEQELTGGIFRPVALKVIRPEYAESADFREMFLDEARTACTLSHPNIVHIYEVGEANGTLYMAMELVSGETLATVSRTLRDRGERFSDEALFQVGILMCSALEAVHALRIEGGHVNLVHRDVSPHNLLLSANGTLKLIDFGIAKAATNRNLTSPGVTKGKAGYFSPEQAMGKALDGRSDLFSVGVTLYKLAAGHTPFDHHRTHQERNGALVRGRWEGLRKACPGLPNTLYPVIEKSMQLKPDNRYPTAKAMREALERAAFDAGLRLGSSVLTGYVDERGEVSSGGLTRSARPSPPSAGRLSASTQTDGDAEGTPTPIARPSDKPGKAIRARTERVEGRPAPLWRKKSLWAAAAAAVLLGGTLMAWRLRSATPTPEAMPALPRVMDVPDAARETVDAALSEAEVFDAGEPAPEVESGGIVIVSEPTVKSAPTPRPAQVRPVEVASPSGQPELGTKLRIFGMNVKASVDTGRKADNLPFDKDVRSGRHVISVFTMQGEKLHTCEVTVAPNAVTKVMVDAQRCRAQ